MKRPLHCALLPLFALLFIPGLASAAPDTGKKTPPTAGSAAAPGTAAGTATPGTAAGTAAPTTKPAVVAPKPAVEAPKKEVPLDPKVAKLLSATGKRHIKPKKEKKLNEGLGKPPKGMDRSSPKAAWSAFLRACKAERWGIAAHIFNLGDIPLKDQRTVGASRAQKLCEVLQTTKQDSASELPESTVGPIPDDKPSNYVVVARVRGEDDKPEEAWLRRTVDEANKREVWVLTRRSLANVGSWHSRLVRGDAGRKALTVINVGLGPLPDSFKVSSPRAAAKTFAELVRQGKPVEAARLLDLSQLEPAKQKARGKRLVRRLAFVLLRLKPGYVAALSNDPPGAPERDVPDDEEQLLTTKIGDQALAVRLGHYRRVGKSRVWLFTAQTVANIDRLYEKYGPGWAGDYLPPVFFNVQFAGVQLWQWIGLLFALVLAFIFGRVAAFFSRKVLIKAAAFTTWDWDDKIVEATKGPMTTLYAALGFVVSLGFLALADAPEKVVLSVVKLITIIAVGWFITRALDVAGEVMLEMFSARQDEVGMAMVPVARKIVKPIVYLLVLIVALQNIGINVAGLLAGLGIGGLALAMASKSTLENMLGGITIAFDRPFKVGDFVKVGDILGAVEEVGLRSTRVRTLDRTIVTVPNGQMADSKVENFAKRDRIRLVFNIGVQYDSSLDQVRYIVDEIKRTILQQPKIVHDGFRVRFIGFGDSALQIEIYVYIDTVDYNEFTAIREELFLIIGGIVEAAGAQFAFPSRTIYTATNGASDSDRALQAASEVKKRREAGELTIPEIPLELREKIEVLPEPKTPA